MKIPWYFIRLVGGTVLAAVGAVACYGHLRNESFDFNRTVFPAIAFAEKDRSEHGILVTVGQAYGTGTHLFPTTHRCVTSGFGERTDPIHGDDGWHGGIDICAAGKNSRAIADGVISFAGVQGGYGNVVEITHDDGYKTLYAHHAELFVKKGDKVKAGDELGEIGSTGRSTGPHLHFEVRKKNKKGQYILINPKTYIN